MRPVTVPRGLRVADKVIRKQHDHIRDLEARNRELTDAGDRMAQEVENRWTGRGGCDCPCCTAAKDWRVLRGD